MPKAHEVAMELRNLADSLDRQPEAEIKRPSIAFYSWGTPDKEAFSSICRLMPRPLTKKIAYDNVHVAYETEAILTYATIPQKDVCELVEPAKPAAFRCTPILSEEEDAELLEVK